MTIDRVAHPSTAPVRRTEGIMITAATRKGNQAYWRGYAEADYDIAANGMSYAVSRYMFGAGRTAVS